MYALGRKVLEIGVRMTICRKYTVRAALCMLLILFCVFCGTGTLDVSAFAEQSGIMLEIGIAARPDEMVKPEDITLTFTITNASQSDASNVYLSSLDGLLYEPVGSIAAGDTLTFTRAHSVTRDELSGGIITYIISMDDPMNADGGRINYTIQAPIKRTEAMPQAEFTRQLSAVQVRAGGAVTITYRIRNTGNVALASLRVQDQLGDYTGRLEYLDVGETRTLINRTDILQDSASSAQLSFCMDGNPNDIHVQSLDDVQITIAQPAISASFNAEYTTLSGNAAKVTLMLSNNGNADYRDIVVADDVNGGIIADHVALPAGGEPVIVEGVCPIRGEMDLRWRITGADAAGGSVDFTTETLVLTSVRMNAPSELTVSAHTQTPEIRRDGNVRMQLRISNSGGADITDAVLSDGEGNEIRTFAVIPGNGYVDREIIRNVQADSDYVFAVSYVDSDGWERTAQCDPVHVAITPEGVQPEGVKQSLIEFTGRSIKVGGSELFAWLLIAACAVLIVLIVVLSVSARRERIRKQVRMATERQMRRTGAQRPTRHGARPSAKKTGKGKA